MKIILNKCYGGFEVSPAGYKLYAKKKGFELYPYVLKAAPGFEYNVESYYYKKIKWEEIGHSSIHYLKKDYGDKISRELFKEIADDDYFWINSTYRTDSTLIEVVEELGQKASGPCGELRIVEIPDDLDYVIDEYDGIETLHQRVKEW